MTTLFAAFGVMVAVPVAGLLMAGALRSVERFLLGKYQQEQRREELRAAAIADAQQTGSRFQPRYLIFDPSDREVFHSTDAQAAMAEFVGKIGHAMYKIEDTVGGGLVWTKIGQNRTVNQKAK